MMLSLKIKINYFVGDDKMFIIFSNNVNGSSELGKNLKLLVFASSRTSQGWIQEFLQGGGSTLKF